MRKIFKIAVTSDVHGMLFPFDFTTLTPAHGSLARVSTYVSSLRQRVGDSNVILLDNGDMLQGQPSVYYYNFIAADVTHPIARMMKYLRYDAQTIGNHDLETGHPVYDRYCGDLAPISLLGANVLNISTGQPYFKPYVIIERDGVRFAILGLITPAIPAWLPQPLWSGMEIDDMVSAARKWVDYIREHERPDMVIGLFHSGYESTHLTGRWYENESALVAREVEGLDLIFMGHDHMRAVRREDSGVMLLNPGAHARLVAEATVVTDVALDGHVAILDIDGDIVSLDEYEPDNKFLSEFSHEYDGTLNFVERVIGQAGDDFRESDAYFGPSAFMEMIHRLQLDVSGADISIAAPTSFDAILHKGSLRISDMFTLYRYENQLCTLSMTGLEIKNHLEMSYNLWTAVMTYPDDDLLKFSSGNHIKGDYPHLINPSYNFDSAFGINYTVDVTKPKGEKITIESMADGSAFNLDKTYKVAINSYRANGGGELLTRGAGIPIDKLGGRLIDTSTYDLRYYLIESIRRQGTIYPQVTPNWRFVPEDFVSGAIKRNHAKLFERHF